MDLSNLKKQVKNKRRLGRGISAGQGKTAGRGTKGQKSRTGKKLRPGFEGGQMPLVQRLPKKRGFTSRNKKAQTVRLERLNMLKDGTNVNAELLVKEGIVRSEKVKIVAGGDFSKKLNIQVPASKDAIAQITKAGGTYEVSNYKG